MHLLFSPASGHRLPALDLALVALYLVGITLFGLRFRSKDRTLRGYFLAGRDIPWWAISLSIVAAETSTLTIISVPGVAYAGNFGFLQIVFGYLAGRVVVALLFLPKYFQGELFTAYQLIDRRFGARLHKVTAALFLLTRAAAEGVRVFAVSIVIGIAIGTRDIPSIALISALTLLYTLEGGMAAVIWTDVVQMILYVGGTLVGLWTLGNRVHGGWAAISQIVGHAGKFHLFDFALNLTTTYTFWAGLLGGMFLTMASHGTDQLMVQRLLVARTLRDSRLALLSSGLVILLQFTLFLLAGAGLYVFYMQQPPLVPFASADRIFPTFIVTQMPSGISGLLVAAILAAAMSNLSAALNSLSSTTVIDFYMHWRPAAKERERTFISRSSTFFWAVALFVLAIFSRGGGHVVEVGLSIASVAYGAMLGVFLLGTLTRAATETGAILGMITGFALNVFLWRQSAALHFALAGHALTLPKVAFTWYVLIGSVATFAVGYLASALLRAIRKSTAAVSAAMLLLCALFAASTAFAQSPATATNSPGAPSIAASSQWVGAHDEHAPDFSQIDALMADALAAHQLPGAVVLIGHNGSVAFDKAYGKRSLEPAVEAMTLDTVFDMASLTKCLATATAILQLHEKGLLNFDDPVAKYLPAFAVNGKELVTLRQLLTHYSGLPPDVDLKQPWAGKDAGVRLAMESKLMSPPGDVFRYSDINYIALGLIVEKLSGQSLNEYAQQHIFAPLGMEHTRFLPPASWLPRIAPTEYDEDNHMLRGSVHDPTARRMGGVAGHAGVFSTAADVSLFAQALLDKLAGRPSKFPLSQESLKLMTSPEQPGGGKAVRGFGWDIDSDFSGPRGSIFPIGSFGHTGFTGTSLWMDPGSDTYIVVLANAVHPRATRNITPLRRHIATAAARALRLYDPAHSVLNGIDVLESTRFAALKEAAARNGGHLRLGLLTNQTGLDRNGRRTADILARDARAFVPGVELKTLFSPEHGINGAADTMSIGDSTDLATGLPVISLYGSKDEQRRPKAADLKQLDAVIIDLQDAGVRFYTYETVTGYFLEAAAKAGIEVFVLDRPNPINGLSVQGPVSDAGAESYIDYMPLPIRHGMTLGELARYFNQQRHLGAKLSVVKMDGWQRGDWFDDTHLPWVNPSPNLRSLAEATLYPGVALFDASNVSVDRGSDVPFGHIGAPWIDADVLAAYLNARRIPGVYFYPDRFTPVKPYPHAGVPCNGVRFVIADRNALDSPELGIELVSALHTLYPAQFHLADVNPLLANKASLRAIEAKEDPREIAKSWGEGLKLFASRREAALLYGVAQEKF